MSAVIDCHRLSAVSDASFTGSVPDDHGSHRDTSHDAYQGRNHVRITDNFWHRRCVHPATLLTEFDDRWRLRCRGMQVVQVRVSYQLTLLLATGETATIETEALLTHGPRQAPDAVRVALVPERQDVAALVLFGATVLSSVAFKSGALRLVFDTGHHLTVKPHPQLTDR
jgi:hypothetical protein